MIRINLLPVKEARRRAAAKRFIFVSLAVIIVELVIFGVFYFIQLNRHEKLTQQVSQVEARVQKVNSVEKEIKKIQSQIKENEKKLGVLENLRKKRTGAFEIIYELQTFLTPPTSERIKIQQRKRNWDATWAPGRLWIQSLTAGTDNFNLSGFAKSADDVAEFLFRLETSNYFVKPVLDYVTVEGSNNADVSIVSFQINGGLNFNPEPKESG